MASPLTQASLRAPGFRGLNTEQQTAKSQEQFATVLENAVFDEAGKIAARKGFDKLADGGPDSISRLFWWRKSRTDSRLMCIGDASGTATIYEMTATTQAFDTFTSRGTFASTDIKLVNVNGYLVAVEQGATPQVWDGTGNFANFAAATGTTANPTGGVAISAFGRLFITSADGKTVFGSELQPDPKTTGCNWDNWFIDTTGNSGATSKDGWTYGRDYITGLGAFSEFLCIFGKESVQLYSDPNGTLSLADSITGVGCVSQHTIANIGDDLLFLSNTGIRSLIRTLNKDTPSLNDISAFVRSDVVAQLSGSSDVQATYNPLDGFYLISSGDNCYMFDVRQYMPGGASRASVWTLEPDAMAYDPDNNRLFLAVGDAVGLHDGYVDDAASYKLTLKSAWLDLRRPNIKIAKKMAATIYKGDGYTPKFLVAFDYDENGEEVFFGEAIPTISGDEWNVAEWGIGEWAIDPEQVNQRYIQAAGSGLFIRYGLEFNINGNPVGIEEVRILAKLGKLAHV